MTEPSLFRTTSDPYALYRTLHERGPVLWDKWLRSWIVIGHAEVRQLSRDVRLSGARVEAFYELMPPKSRSEMATLKNALADMMLFNEPPRHTRLRNLIKPGLTPAIVLEMRTAIEELTAELLDAVIPLGRMDVIHDYSEPLTRALMGRLAGVPEHGKSLLRNWQGLLHEFYTESRAEIPRITALRGVFDERASARRAGVATDAFSRMIANQLQRSEYSEDEIFANFLLLIDAGQATTTHQIANAMVALIEYEDQQHLLRQHPELASNAAHEFLRYDSSVQFTSRVALADIEVAGQRIREGQSVALVLGAANRDPDHYERPDRLDVTRVAHDHQAFGHGIHYCLGAALALAEIEIAVARLLARATNIRLDAPELEWVASLNFRFLRRLPISFTPVV